MKNYKYVVNYKGAMIHSNTMKSIYERIAEMEHCTPKEVKARLH